MIGEHESTDLVAVWQVGRLAGQCHLNGRRAPGNEWNFRMPLIADPLQCFMNLCRVNVVALNDIQNRNVTSGT